MYMYMQNTITRNLHMKPKLTVMQQHISRYLIPMQVQSLMIGCPLWLPNLKFDNFST